MNQKFLYIIFLVLFTLSCNKGTINKTTAIEEKNNVQDMQQYVSAKNLHEAVYNGDIDYIQKYLENFDRYSQEHESFSNGDLRILRNTIYAMHGYIFKSKDLQEYFQKFAWYKNTKENVDDELSEKELQLIRIISAMEAANPPKREDLIGNWVIPVPASVERIGFLDLYLEPDGNMSGFANGSWSWDGAIFRTVPASNKEWLEFSWVYGDKKEIRIIIFEHDGELYRATSFFDESNYIRQYRDWYQANKMPSLRSGYWGNWENTEED
jgi:hypothetical protein